MTTNRATDSPTTRPSDRVPTKSPARLYRMLVCAVASVVMAQACSPPPQASVPVGSRVMFTGDYDTGNLSQWWTLQARGFSEFPGLYCTYSACVQDGGSAHETAARYEVRDGDIPPFGGGERSEVRSGDGVTSGGYVVEGDERWYELSIKFDETFRNPRTKSFGWFIVMQWFPGNASPPLTLQVSTANMLVLGGDGVARVHHRDIGPLRPGIWVDYVLHVKFSNDPAIGYAEVWQDGRPAVARHSRPTMNSPRSYLKQGIYRDAGTAGHHVVWHDGLRVTAR